MAYTYILRCADGSFSVGSTRDLEHRHAQHNDGEGAVYTSTRLPVRLVYFEKFDRIDDAYRREKQVQGWGRAKRIALMTELLDALPTLSKKRFRSRAIAGVEGAVFHVKHARALGDAGVIAYSHGGELPG